jgi:hypothetical protein
VTPKSLRLSASLTPLALALLTTVAPTPGFELPKYAATAVFLGLTLGSIAAKSDGLNKSCLYGQASLLALASAGSGYFLSFATVIAMLVVVDTVGLIEKLFGLTAPAIAKGDGGASTGYLRLVEAQAARSGALGAGALAVSLAVVYAPFPVVAFGNPVSSVGVLAISALALILVALSELKRFRSPPQRPGPG